MISILQQLLKSLPGQLTSPPLLSLENSEQQVPGIRPSDLLTFDQTLGQMSRGYENTQRVVQFMDAKVGAVIALSLGIFVLTGKLVVGVNDRLGEGMLISHGAPLCFIIWGMMILMIGVGFGGFICLHHAFKAVRPNGLPLPEHFSTLFPIGSETWENDRANEYLEKVVAGETRWFILDEYKRQLLAMGGIVYLKISSLRTAIRALWWQGLFSFLLLLFIGAMVGFGLYPNKTEQPLKRRPMTTTSATIDIQKPPATANKSGGTGPI